MPAEKLSALFFAKQLWLSALAPWPCDPDQIFHLEIGQFGPNIRQFYSFPFFNLDLVVGDFCLLQEAGHRSIYPKLTHYVDDGREEWENGQDRYRYAATDSEGEDDQPAKGKAGMYCCKLWTVPKYTDC